MFKKNKIKKEEKKAKNENIQPSAPELENIKPKNIIPMKDVLFFSDMSIENALKNIT